MLACVPATWWFPIDDPQTMRSRGSDILVAKRQSLGVGRLETNLPRDASKTLFVKGLPKNCSRREVAHIFRPFLGYEDVRLVSKDSRHFKGSALVLCFVDFLSPAHAATAMNALQGYRFDEQDRDSVSLRLQFARCPGARSGGRHRGWR
ncbi:nuclear speckle RNA-binding protein A-like [Apium graveolens]|uniref:nuclear speckle RNA-binding protein A-like n=1 Tax=Apium graveolens TaxID=4045 RepID=UPI003D7A9952